MGEIATLTAAALANHFKGIYEGDGGYCIRFYADPRRASPSDAVGAATLLCTVTAAGGSGLTWQTAVDELLSKTTSEVWEGTNADSGVSTWGCLSPLTDTGDASTTIHRTDFSIGLWTDKPLPDCRMSSNILTLGEVTRINSATLVFVKSVDQLQS